MSAFVVDVSACMPWCCEDEATPESDQLLQRAAARDPLHVPALWLWEMLNALAVAQRRKRIDAVRASAFLELLPRSISGSRHLPALRTWSLSAAWPRATDLRPTMPPISISPSVLPYRWLLSTPI